MDGTETLTNKTLTAPTINGGTHTAFTSTGIDDNATSTAITIDASENVGIGVTPSAAYKMQVNVATNTVTTGSPASSSLVNIAGGTTTVGDGVSLQLSNTSGAKETAWRVSAVTASGNNGDLVFNGYAGGADYPERLRISSAGNVKISSSAVTPEGRLDIDSGSYSANPAIMLGGNIDTTGAGGRGDNARKYASIVGKHFSNEEQPVGILAYDCQSDALAIINYGIPSSNYNSPTEHRFFTTANATTVGGNANLRMTIDSGGHAIIGGGITLGNGQTYSAANMKLALTTWLFKRIPVRILQ